MHAKGAQAKEAPRTQESLKQVKFLIEKPPSLSYVILFILNQSERHHLSRWNIQVNVQ